MKSLRWILMVALVCGLAACGGQEGTNGGDTAAGGDVEENYVIAVIPKGTANPFWKTVHAGAASAAEELGNVEITWVGPENEDDRNQQINVVQNQISRGVDAIVLAPLDAVALVRPVETAVGRDIPVIIIDSNLDSEIQSSFVATDNTAGGRLGAQRLGELMNGEGKAILMRYQVGSASTDNREEGFTEELAEKFPGIELISQDQYAGVTREEAAKTAQNLLNKYGSEIQGIFCPNESSTYGMLRALENTGYAGKINFVGFDASADLIKGMENGYIHGLVAQDPFDMGAKGVRTAVKVIEGEAVDKYIPTRLTLVTPENLSTPEIQELISTERETN